MTGLGMVRVAEGNAEGMSVNSPTITITRMVEEDDVVMAEMTLEALRATGKTMRAAIGEVFVFRDGKIAERRAYMLELRENDPR